MTKMVAGASLKVLYVNHVAALSGGEIALLRLVRSIAPLVHVTVILGEDGPLHPRLVTAGAVVQVLPMPAELRTAQRNQLTNFRAAARRAAQLFSYARQLRRSLKHERPDVVHVNSLKAGYCTAFAAASLRLPLVWHLRDRLADDYMPGAVARATGLVIRAVSSAVVANSQSTAQTLPRSARRSVTVLPDPYDPPQRPQTPTERLRPFTFGVIGRLSPWKGQDVALRAFSCAFPGGDTRLRVVGAALFGEDAFAEQLRADHQASLTRERIDLVGHVDDVEAELASLDCLVHCSVVPEPFGQVVVESLAAGVPVIAAGAGGVMEILGDGRFGVLHAPGDVVALAEAMQRVASDGDLRARLARDGLARASDYSGHRLVRAYLDLYENAVGGRLR